jgi:hypothetical protein
MHLNSFSQKLVFYIGLLGKVFFADKKLDFEAKKENFPCNAIRCKENLMRLLTVRCAAPKAAF